MPKYLNTKPGSLESAVLEAVSPAQQAAIAISKKEKGEKPKDEKDEGNAFTGALKAAKEKGEKTFTVAGKKYDVKTEEDKLDKVNPVAVKKKFDDRKDKDIDNDGDVDSTDKYLHKRRKAISKAVNTEDKQLQEKPADYLELEFKDKREANRAYDMINNKLYASGHQPFNMDVPEGNSLQFEDLRDADKLMKDLKKAGFKFKVYERESVQEDLDEGRMKELHGYMEKGMSAQEIAKKMKLDVKTIEALMDEKEVDEKTEKESVKEENSLAERSARAITSMWKDASPKTEEENPKKKEEKDAKTMTGKPMTKVEVSPSDEAGKK